MTVEAFKRLEPGDQCIINTVFDGKTDLMKYIGQVFVCKDYEAAPSKWIPDIYIRRFHLLEDMDVECSFYSDEVESFNEHPFCASTDESFYALFSEDIRAV